MRSTRRSDCRQSRCTRTCTRSNFSRYTRCTASRGGARGGSRRPRQAAGGGLDGIRWRRSAKRAHQLASRAAVAMGAWLLGQPCHSPCQMPEQDFHLFLLTRRLESTRWHSARGRAWRERGSHANASEQLNKTNKKSGSFFSEISGRQLSLSVCQSCRGWLPMRLPS
jgi:hypothetical protein